MRYFFRIVGIFLILFLVIRCSSTEESTEKKESDSTYIFDQVPTEEILTIDTPVDTNSDYSYVVQIGAFTSEEKADEFAGKSSSQIGKQLKVSFSDRVNLYVVYLDPPFKTKSEAENVRNQLWQSDDFRDAWIVSIKKKKK